MTVIDIHTHMIPREWLDLLQSDGGDYELKPTRVGHMAIHLAGAPFVTLMPEMFDYDARLRAMDEAGVDMAVLSLTGPNVFWGTPAVSAKAARIANAAYAERQGKYPDRIRWVASIPWETPDAALADAPAPTARSASPRSPTSAGATWAIRCSRRSGRRSTGWTCRCSFTRRFRPAAATCGSTNSVWRRRSASWSTPRSPSRG